MEIKEGADGKNCLLMWTAMDRQHGIAMFQSNLGCPGACAYIYFFIYKLLSKYLNVS